jgi:hypothetical protein
MKPKHRLEAKLKSSLISNVLEKEVVDKLDWYRNALYAAKTELNALKNKVWTETPYKQVSITLYWK